MRVFCDGPTDAENTVQSAFFATVETRFLRQPYRRRMGVWLQGMKKQEGVRVEAAR